MELYIWARNGKKRTDATNLVTTLTWSGEKSMCARTCEFSLVSSATDKHIPSVPCEVMDKVDLYHEGKLLFRGEIWSRTKATGGNTIDVTAYDAGYRLTRIDGVYKFKKKTPREIVEKLAKDYSLKLGNIANPNVKITRNFIGISLYKIIQTAYTLAAEKTGVQYQIEYVGDYLEVTQRGARDATYAITPKANLMSGTITESAEKVVTRVKIYDKEDKFKANKDDKEGIQEFGILQKTVRQTEKDNKSAEAKQLLKEGKLSQKITVEALGDVRCRTGDAVYVKEPYTGITGRFFIDEDAHTWKNGQYYNKMTLNFKNLMEEMTAGGENAGYAKSKKTKSGESQVSLSEPRDWMNEDRGNLYDTSRASVINKVIAYAEQAAGRGTTYSTNKRYGDTSYDCSGLVYKAWEAAGVKLVSGYTVSAEATRRIKINRGDPVGTACTQVYALGFQFVYPSSINVEDFNYNADKIEEALNEKADKANPEISGTVKITKTPVKIMGKNYAGEEVALLQAGVNASDNLWIGIDNITPATATHGGNTYISAGKNGQIRAVLSQEGVSHEMLHRGNVNQVLWEGSWNSGDITVLGANSYKIYHVEFLEQGCPIIMMKKEGFLRGVGGYASNNGIIVYGFRGAYSGEKFSFLEARNLSISTGNTNELTVSRIIGLI